MSDKWNPDKVKEKDNAILIAALKHLGVEAAASGRNDMVVKDKKVITSIFFVKFL